MTPTSLLKEVQKTKEDLPSQDFGESKKSSRVSLDLTVMSLDVAELKFAWQGIRKEEVGESPETFIMGRMEKEETKESKSGCGHEWEV